MRTTISVRHTEISAALRTRAEQVMGRLGRLSPHALEATVVFDRLALARLVEIRLHVRRGQILVGQGRGSDHRTALDRALDKVRRQLSRDGAQARRTKARRVKSSGS
jgi:ribosomal subunit interface protein